MTKTADLIDKTSLITGRVLSVLDGVILVEGLSTIGVGEIVLFENQGKGDKTYVLGMAMNIYPTIVGVVLLGNDFLIKNGSRVWRTFDSLLIKVGLNSFGRYLNALGEWVSLGNNTKVEILFTE